MPRIILMNAPEVARVPVVECGELFVDLGELPLLEVDARQVDPDGAHAMVREEVAMRLERAARLLPEGLRLLVTEGYRPLGPHVTGAAVDVTLCTRHGDELDLGTPVDACPEASGGACCTDAPNISDQARRNRLALCAALTTAGLINCPTEWWHWSFGDRYWALLTGAPAARYGPM